MNYKTIYTRAVEDRIVEVVINRPRNKNTLTLEVLVELGDIFEKYSREREAPAIILRGEGGDAFIAGADLKELYKMDPLEFRDYNDKLYHLTRLIREYVAPVVGAVNGFAFGIGNIIAMCCDFVFATPESSFGQQEMNFGIVGGIPRLIYLVGARRAWDLIATGRIIGAPEAEEIGLITGCVNEGDIYDYVVSYCRKLLARPVIAYKLGKTVKGIYENSLLDAACEYEKEIMSLCLATSDAKEGLGAFIEKRKPKFKGR